MFENNNKKVIKKLSKKILISNKRRNVYAIVAIALTALLFTGLFTIGMSIIKSVEQETMRMVGASSHGGFKRIDEEEYNIIKEHPLIKESGYRIMVNGAQNKELQARYIVQIQHNSKESAKMAFLEPTIGKLPILENETVVDTKTLDLLGVKHKIGEKVYIEYNIEGVKYSKDFILSGFFETDQGAAMDVGYVLVSKAFIDENLKGVDVDKNKQMFPYTGTWDMSIMLKNSKNIEGNLETIFYESMGYMDDGVKISVNWAYMNTQIDSLDPTSVLLVSSFLLLVILAGYFIIFNIFQISIVKDIRFYGMLKTIGTTSKQVKKIVRHQSFLLSAMGIPIGLILGYGLGAVLIPIVMSSLTIENSHLSFSPWIFVLSGIFALLTVYISTNKPCRIASRISPIEAKRYNTNKKVRSRKRKSISGKIYKMAWYNIFRDRKKSLFVITSLALSLIVYIIVSMFVQGFNEEDFVSIMSPTDFTFGDNAYYNWYGNGRKPLPVSNTLVEEIESKYQITESEYVYFEDIELFFNEDENVMDRFKNEYNEIKQRNNPDKDELGMLSYRIENKKTFGQLYGVDNITLDILDVSDGEIDKELLFSGDYAITSGDYYKVGEEITISNELGEKTYKVMANVDYLAPSVGCGYYVGFGEIVYIPSDKFVKISKAEPIKYIFNTEDDEMGKIDEFLESYISNPDTHMGYSSITKYIDEYRQMVNMVKIIGGILSAIIGFIGILNFANSIVTSILTRKIEFASMKSIGMTSKQLNKLIIFEGLYYAIMVLVTVIVIGLPLSYLVVNALGEEMWYFSYNLTVAPVLYVAPFLALLTIAIPYLSFKNVNKQPIVEQLREVNS